ncbi:MAG: hypothetical protein Q4C01_01300 [Clostridia bacterium]|nr:hypothetical protein [Clostridia bacterium]
MNDAIHQGKVIKYLRDYPNVGVLIPIYGKMSKLGTDAFFQCCLAPIELVKEEMKTDCTNNWSKCTPGFTQCTSGDDSQIVYHRFGNGDGFEPLIIERNFDGLGIDNSLEVSEEFRLINNLCFDRVKNEYVDPENETTVVKIENGLVTIHKNYLKRFLAVKQMSLLVHLSSRAHNDGVDPEIEQISKPICLDGKNTTISYGIDHFAKSERNYSSIYAKMFINGCNLCDCGYWPYSERQRKYEEFIVGVDNSGKDVTFTSDPNLLNGHGKMNENSPHYFTPIFFKRAVLQKYYDSPKKYEIGGGFLRCGNKWLLYIDNQSADYVVAYLGDLGRDLPSQSEQQHWWQYNISIDGELSRAKWQRDFGGKFTDPDSPVFLFQEKYKLVNELYEEQLGWTLFLPLNTDDTYNFTGLRIPLSNAQPEFDMQILCLVKVLIDSFNEKELSAACDNNASTPKHSIGKFEQFLKVKGVKDYETHIRFLRDLQGLRSTGIGHRKGKYYVKTANKFGLPEKDFKTVFIEIIGKATEFLSYVQDIVHEIH